MSFPNAIHAVKPSLKPALPKFNPARLKTPSPFPQRPLSPNRFTLPKGEKQVFLPNFVLALIRPSPFLPANYASFMVPLWLNKLDLKDYLYNLYNLRVLSVRSYVIQSKISEKGVRGQRRWYRPQSRKKMTVELARKEGNSTESGLGQGPFLWPKIPMDKSPWGKDGLEAKLMKVEDAWRDREGRSKKWPKDFGSLRRKAQKLLRENAGRTTEVEDGFEEQEGMGQIKAGA
ncbi:uncharacterized protein KY384_007698 [Bacidia gigantensis]|uniref:uncharacterized protein n=1 Tax=Bacidia gigantensis TaxID=2732470 RepID=UPI001D04FF18|nr:uncharacterized protein KY384_007698 [Bacidia gigantensis]KAG8527546.1 hypothetical protein KY384_007698 [Bacidia gigantensis]